METVLDASITLTWCFQDERTPKTDVLLEKLETESAFVPGLWTLEIGNILLTACRKQRITYANATEFLSLLNALDIRIDDRYAHYGFHEIFLLAHAEKLTTYDAAYLELAMREGLPLATKDLQLSEAALRLGVEVIS